MRTPKSIPLSMPTSEGAANQTPEQSTDEITRVSRKPPESGEYTVSKRLDEAGAHKESLDFYRRVALLPEVTDIGRSIIERISAITGDLASAAVYFWQQEAKTLKCYAALNYLEKDRQDINKDLYLGLKRKQRPLILHSAVATVREPSQVRLVVPAMLENEVFGFVYVRVKQSPDEFGDVKTALIYDTLRLVAPLVANAMMQKQMDQWMHGMIETILASIGAKDTYTVGHSERVCRFSMNVARTMQLDEGATNKLMFSSLVHDIGKVGIPDAILKKADLLSAEEFDIMRQHPAIGANMIVHMPMAAEIMGGIKHHHERWDGTGYPDGLEGDKIPLFGRIVAITDAFDAMTSGRSYSGFMSVEDAVTRLAEMDDLFCPDVLAAFTKSYEQGDLSIRTGTALNRRFSMVAHRLAAIKAS